MFDMPSVHGVIERAYQAYQKEVVGLIADGEYEFAFFRMAAIHYGLSLRAGEISREIHSGESFLAASKLLEDRLREGESERVASAQRFFEMYCAQTQLPSR